MDSKSALSELKAFQGSRKGAGDYYTQYQNELGVGDAQARSNDIRGLIRNTEGALKGVNSSVAGRTRGQGVNEAQRARLEGIERAPIAQELGDLQGSYADEQQNYRDLLGQATTRAGQSYQTDADRLAGLESNYNKIYQSEQAAAEEARWRQQFDESNRQFAAQMAAADRRAAENKAAIASLRPPTPTGPSAQDQEKQRLMEEAARHVTEGNAAWEKRKEKRKDVTMWDAFLQPLQDSFSNVGRFFGF